MNFEELAKRFLQSTHKMRTKAHQKSIDDTMQGELFALSYLLRQGGTLVPGEISTGMKISSARVAAMLNNLENKGFISRKIDPADRRRILVSLTDEGTEHIKEHQKNVLKKVQSMLERLGEADAGELVRIMERLGCDENRENPQ